MSTVDQASRASSGGFRWPAELGATSLGMLAVVAAATAMLWVWALHDLHMGLASHGWPTVEGVVTRYEVRETNTPDRAPSRRVDLRYRYTVDGRTYGGRRYATGGNPGAGSGISEGAAVRVHYDPADPARAVLRPGLGLKNAVQMGFGLILLAAVLYSAGYSLRVLARAWLEGRRRAPE